MSEKNFASAGDMETLVTEIAASLNKRIEKDTSVPFGNNWSQKTWTGLTNFAEYYIWTDGENIYYSSGPDQYILDKSTSTWSQKTWNGYTNLEGKYIWTDGENIYYSYDNSHYILNKSTSTWSEKTWTGLTSFYGDYIWTDGENIYYSRGSDQYILDKSTSTWSTKTWTGLTSFDGNQIWTDVDNIYYSYNTTHYVLDKTTSTWSTKTWTNLIFFRGQYVWTDGENIYYSAGSNTHYILNKSTSTWSTKSWTGLTSFYGNNIWTDRENIYYSYGSTQYILDKANKPLLRSDGSTVSEDEFVKTTDPRLSDARPASDVSAWAKASIKPSYTANEVGAISKESFGWINKTWSGYSSIDAENIWTDGDDIYYSNNMNQYVLDKSTSTWSGKTTRITYGKFIWTDGENIYYSNQNFQKVLTDKSNMTWSEKTWNGEMEEFDAYYIWTDGENIYYSQGNTAHYVLDKSTSTWSKKTWNGLTSFDGRYIWTDGDNIYYSQGNAHYVLNKSTSTWSSKTWNGYINFEGKYIWTDGENIYYSYGSVQYIINTDTSTCSQKTWSGNIVSDGSKVWTDGNNMYCSDASNFKQYVLNKIYLVKSDGSKDTSKYAKIASGDMSFGVDSNGNYGYIKAGADTVTPFKTGNVTVVTAATSISSGSNATLSTVKKGDIIIINRYGTTSITFTSLSVTTLVSSLYARSTTYGNAIIYVANADGTSSSKVSNPTSYTMQYCVLRIS